jgi:peptidoglycan/xylan/chitin deacetylase (PgdA/CDA1 family)
MVNRAEGVLLPRYLLTSPGSRYEAFEADADWTLYNAGSKATNTSEFKQGSASEKLTTRSGASTMIRRTVAWDLSAAERMGLWIYVHDPVAEYHADDGLVIFFQTSATLVDYYRIKFRGSFMQTGWNYFAYPLSRALVTAGANWASIIRLSFEGLPVAGQVVSLSMDDLWLNMRGVPVILLCFDDAYDSAYDIAFAHMQAHNIRGTVGCWTNQVGAGGYCSWAELREMNAAGWAIANHSCDDVDFSTLTQAEIEARLVEAAADLAAAGLSRCAKYVIYPAGGCNATSDLALAAQGMVCGRTTSPHTTRPLVLPHHNLYRLESTSVSNSVSLATVQGYVDTAITEKAILPLHFHDIDGGTGWTSAEFNTLIDYIASKAGEIYPITIDELVKLNTRSIRVPEVVP